MTSYLDASLMVPILVKERASAVVDALMSTAEEKPWVSDLAAAEVALALSRLVRIGGASRRRTGQPVFLISTFGAER